MDEKCTIATLLLHDLDNQECVYIDSHIVSVEILAMLSFS